MKKTVLKFERDQEWVHGRVLKEEKRMEKYCDYAIVTKRK